MNYVKVIRRGDKNTRVLLENGSTRLVRNSELSTWTCTTSRNSSSSGLEALNFGMEFEFFLPRNNQGLLERKLYSILGDKFAGNSHSYHVTQYAKWQWGTDASIHPPIDYVGIELKTPIFGIRKTTDYDELKAVLAAVNELGGKVNASTGTHVHLSFGNQRISTETSRALFDCYGRWEDSFFDRIVAPSRRSSRYCQSCKDHRYYDRYHKLNIVALDAYGTLEFRQHQGTLSYNKIVSWLGVISTWTKVVTLKHFPAPQSFDQALTILGMGSALTTWARSRYEDFNND